MAKGHMPPFSHTLVKFRIYFVNSQWCKRDAWRPFWFLVSFCFVSHFLGVVGVVQTCWLLILACYVLSSIKLAFPAWVSGHKSNSTIGRWFPNQQSMLWFASYVESTHIFFSGETINLLPRGWHTHSLSFFPLVFFSLYSVAPIRCKWQSAVTGPPASGGRSSQAR